VGRTSLWWWGDKLDQRLWAAGRATRGFGHAETTFSLRRATIDIVCEVGGSHHYEALLHLHPVIAESIVNEPKLLKTNVWSVHRLDRKARPASVHFFFRNFVILCQSLRLSMLFWAKL
jgi:hypothetical protein